MLYETYDKHGFKVIKFNRDLGINSNIVQLRDDIRNFLNQQYKHFAIWFTPGSFLYTRTIAILVQCLEMIKNYNGTLTIISPNDDILYTLRMIGFMNFVKLCSSDEKLNA